MRYSTLLSFSLIGVIALVLPARAHAAIVFEDTFARSTVEPWTVVSNYQWDNKTLPCMNGTQPAFWTIFLEQIGIEIQSPACVTEILPRGVEISEYRSYSFTFDMNITGSMAEDRNFLLKKNDTSFFGFHVLGSYISAEKVINGTARLCQTAVSIILLFLAGRIT